MTESILQWFMNLLSGMPNQLIVFIVSMVPIVELRGGLIAAALLKMPLWEGVFFCLLGNMVPVPFILWFITPIFTWLKKTKLFRPLVEKLEAKSMGKSEKIQKYQFWGLVLFVGIPLPGTGAWTGALVAAFLNLRLRDAIPAIFIGVCIAAAIMTGVTFGVIHAF